MRLVIALTLAIFATACGDGYAPPLPPKKTTTWDQVSVIISRDCGECHNGSEQPVLTPSSVFLASPAKAYLTSGRMPPPPATISAVDKQTLLDYLNNN